MLDDLKIVLDAQLFTSPGGKVITLGQMAGVLLLLIFGYLGSRLVGYLLGKRLAGTKLRPDVIYVLKRI
ncbi:MAG: hypothetical protein WBM80_03955, partial [Woeseiaceae bacterium]